MKAVICAIAKFEYDYIKEWVEYHLNLGFDKIVIYDNNDLDGERYDDLLAEYIKTGQVELRDVRGKLAMQRIVYNEFYHEGDFDWVCNLDIDEFISPNRAKYKNIKEFIKNIEEKSENVEAIYLYWQTFGDSGKTYPAKYKKPTSILKQYSVPANRYCLIDNAIKRQNSWGKSLIKKGLPVAFLHEHFVVEPDVRYFDSNGNLTIPGLVYPDDKYIQSTYKECYIKHIYTKSLYEYIDCKVRRPAANSLGEMHFPSKYFKVNDITEEKRRYLESIGWKMEFIFKPDVYLIVEVKNLEEYNKLKPYIFNILELCSVRFNLCVTEDESCVSIIDKEIHERLAECYIYYNPKENTLTDFNFVFLDDRKNLLEYTNSIIHMGIPYNIDVDKYIEENIKPIFGKDTIKQNFMKVFNSPGSAYVSKNEVYNIDNQSVEFKKFKELLNSVGISTNLNIVAATCNFIAKTKDVLLWKDVYFKLYEHLNNPAILVYFISNMFSQFIFTD